MTFQEPQDLRTSVGKIVSERPLRLASDSGFRIQDAGETLISFDPCVSPNAEKLRVNEINCVSPKPF